MRELAKLLASEEEIETGETTIIYFENNELDFTFDPARILKLQEIEEKEEKKKDDLEFFSFTDDNSFDFPWFGNEESEENQHLSFESTIFNDLLRKSNFFIYKNL